ncbi:arginyltransferase [Shewanella sp. OPT22]|nr:arginyltransferase [Shewanella sp. OPT22]
MNNRPTSTEELIYFGLTHPFDCSYLSGQKEQLLTLTDYEIDLSLYERLLSLGFRRNGSAIYKPHCPACAECKPIRINVDEFKLSKRQKRTLKKNERFTWKLVDQNKEEYFQLYQEYIEARHSDGPMYPADRNQYEQFLLCSWLPDSFIEIYDEDKLIGVAVTDILKNSVSAIYSFFDNDYADYSLGSFMILVQIELAQQTNKQYVYLGYQIDECRKMNYKKLYRPFEVLTDQGWQRHN